MYPRAGCCASSATTGGAAASSAGTSGGAAAPSAASGGAAASSATSGGATAASGGAEVGSFFLLLFRFWVIGRLGLPLTAGGMVGTVRGVELYLRWEFQPPTMVDVIDEVPEAQIPQFLNLPQAERLIEADVKYLLNISLIIV